MIFFCSERSSLLLTSLSLSPSLSLSLCLRASLLLIQKKSFSLFFVLPPSFFLLFDRPPPLPFAHSCNFSLSSRAAKNQSSMHSTTFETKLFTFTTCLCARLSCFREGINLATPASEGRLNFFLLLSSLTISSYVNKTDEAKNWPRKFFRRTKRTKSGFTILPSSCLGRRTLWSSC